MTDAAAVKRVLIIGAGGHARVLLDALEHDPSLRVAGILDRDERRRGETVLGFPILGDDSAVHLSDFLQIGCHWFAIGVGGIDARRTRASLFSRLRAAGLLPLDVRHPAAVCSRHAHIGPGTQLLAGSVVGPGSSVGENVIVNTGAIVEHDCRVEAHTHLAPQVCLAGGVQVGMGCHIGMGARIRENIRIGDGAVVGAGAVVIRDVIAGDTVVGVPARSTQGIGQCLEA